jgi:SAM-dependent methyltransferase
VPPSESTKADTLTPVSRDVSELHPAAAVGFGHNATDYELARPVYPPDAVDSLVGRLDLGPTKVVVDVGAGTGKLTRLLLPSGVAVVAVEPVESMRTELRQTSPQALVCAATAEHLPLASGRVEAIVCAQAFHWFATPGVLREFARVLKVGGGLGLLWNVRDNSVPWVRSFTDLLRPFEGDRPDHNDGQWRSPFETDRDFGPIDTRTFFHEQSMTPGLLVSRAASMSFVGALDDSTRADVLERVHELGCRQGPSFGLPYRTDVHLTFKR